MDDRQRTQIAVAALADPQRQRLTSAGVLPGHKPQPCRQLPTTAEISSISDRCHHGGRSDRANSSNLRKPLASFIAAMPLLDLLVYFIHQLIECPQMFTDLP
jgi:hypothetical protein